MIKSVTYLGEGKRSYEVTEESDIQALETNLAEGSSVRVVGKIESEYELQGGTWRKTAGGGGGSALPAVTSDDNGKVLSVVDGEWEKEDKQFVVTCTPTAQDYSGTMDKTNGDIRLAYLSGKEIWFTIPPYTVPVAAIGHSSIGATFTAYMIMTSNHVLVVLDTRASDDDDNTYSTKIYQLTPLSS